MGQASAGRVRQKQRLLWEAILFDFDGTLVETRHDLATAINCMRADMDASPLPVAEIVRHIGWGVRNLVAQCYPELDKLRARSALPPDGDARQSQGSGSDPAAQETAEEIVGFEQVSEALAAFRRHYRKHMLDTSYVYEGLADLLWQAYRKGIPLAVVSNKPERFCREILAGLHLAEPTAHVMGGESLPQRKPAPEPLLVACHELGASPEASLMVGDSALDLRAARAAGVRSCAVLWGLGSQRQLEAEQPDFVVSSASELGAVLGIRLR